MGLTRNLPQLSNFQGRRRSLVLHSQAVILSGPVGVAYTKPPLKEKTASIHFLSSYHKLARIQEAKSTGKEVGVVEPRSGSRSQPGGTLSEALRCFWLWFFSSAPHSFLFPLFSIRGILEIKYSKQLLSKVNMSPSSFRFSESSFLLGSGITPSFSPSGKLKKPELLSLIWNKSQGIMCP